MEPEEARSVVPQRREQVVTLWRIEWVTSSERPPRSRASRRSVSAPRNGRLRPSWDRLTHERVRAVRTALARLVRLLRSVFGGRSKTPVGFVEIEVDDSVAVLDEIEHVVVLMLENRSFDHMLGYLSLDEGGLDVDGLAEGMSNVHDGRSYPIFRLTETAFTNAQDPCHSGVCVDEQTPTGTPASRPVTSARGGMRRPPSRSSQIAARFVTVVR
jgi:hypothetical protein